MEHNSYLIQRLKKPFDKEPENLLEAISTYGLQATGFNREARELLKHFCVFDYMGSAEFEFGAIPEVFAQLIADKDKLIAKAYPVPFYFRRWGDDIGREGSKLVFVICRAQDEDEVVKRICHFAVDDPAYHTKERVRLDESLAEYKYAQDIFGWLELDNGYMFFKDETMFNNFKALFGIKEKE